MNFQSKPEYDHKTGFVVYPDAQPGDPGAKADFIDHGGNPIDPRRYYAKDEADLEWEKMWTTTNKLPETAPEGHSLITCYFEEGGLDTVLPPTDAHFVDIADAFVGRLFPELMGTRDMATVVRWDAAIPNPAPGIYRQIHEMKQRLDPASPTQLAGDYFTCTGQNSAIHWGQVAADNIARIGRNA